MRASLCAVAVTAACAPSRPFIRRRKPPRAPWLWCRLWAARRNACAARLTPPARPAGLDPAAGLLPIGTQPQPATELLHRRELRYPRADLADQGQRRQLADPLDLRQVQPDHVVQRRADVETRRVDAALRTRLWLQRGQGSIALHPPQLEGDLLVHLRHLSQGELPGLVGLLQLEQVLFPVRPGQSLGDLGLAGLTLLVAILG